MEKTREEYEAIIVKLMRKDGNFTERDIREIKSIPSHILGTAFHNIQDKNHFRHLFFNGQFEFMKVLKVQSMELIADCRRLVKTDKQRKREKFLKEHPDLNLRDDGRFAFLADIGSATPAQMQLMWEEGLRRGINFEDNPVADAPLEPQFDDDFGEAAERAALQLTSGSHPNTFVPIFSSTPLSQGAQFQLFGPTLDAILEENEPPPACDDPQPNQGELADVPVSSTPKIPHPSQAAGSRRIGIPFNLNEVATREQRDEPLSQALIRIYEEIPELQLPPQVSPVQRPDFERLREEARRRYSTPVQPPRVAPRRRTKKNRGTELWELERLCPLNWMSSAKLRSLLQPQPKALPPFHLYGAAASSTRPPLQQTETPSNQQIRASGSHSSSSIAPKNASASTSTDRQAPGRLQLPSIGETEEQQPVIPIDSIDQPPILAEVQQHAQSDALAVDPPMDIDQPPPLNVQIPRGAQRIAVNISGQEPQVDPIIQVIQSVPGIDQEPPINLEPERSLLWQSSSIQQASPEKMPVLTDLQKGMIEKILRLLKAKKEITVRELKEKFPSKIEMVGVFRLLLEFNGIMWTMISNETNDFVGLKFLSF